MRNQKIVGYTSIMARIFYSFTLIFAVFYGFTGAFAAYEIAAVVNDRIISVSDLKHRMKLALLSSGLEDSPEVRKHLQEQIIKAMIDEALQLSTTEKYDIKINNAEVLQAFNDFENRANMKPGQLKELLVSHHIPLEVFYNQIRANLAWREYIQARYRDTIQISDQDIERSHRQFEVKKDKPQLLLGEIFLSVGSEEEEKRVEEQAQEFVQQLRKGVQFSALAQQFSQSASAARGGSIGWVTEDDLDSLLINAIRNLEPGQISDPIKTPTGYYILLVKERRAAGESIEKDTLLSFLQVLFSVTPPFSDEKLYPVFNQAKSIVFNSKSCGVLKTLIKADKTIQVREVQKARTSEMPPQLKELLLKLGTSNPSEPILTDMGFVVFMVCAKEEVNPDNPTPNQIREILFEQKLAQLSQRELRDSRRSAHIDIRIKGEVY